MFGHLVSSVWDWEHRDRAGCEEKVGKKTDRNACHEEEKAAVLTEEGSFAQKEEHDCWGGNDEEDCPAE